MNLKDKIDFHDIKTLVDNALNMFYDKDSILLEYSDVKHAVAERCMVFRIGWYMLEIMKDLPDFQWADLDCEYNRNFNNPKAIYELGNDNLSIIKKAIPDLLIHQRKSNENNLLVIEFKKENPSLDEVANDEEKLLYFTNEQSIYGYSFGLYIELHREKAEIKVYQNGRNQANLNYTWIPKT